MKQNLRLLYVSIAVSLIFAAVPAAQAAIIWDSDVNGTVTFTKPYSSDHNLLENRDVIVLGVELTCKNYNGVFNYTETTGYGSADGTEWAFSGLDGNPVFAFGQGASNHGNLNFDKFKSALHYNVNGYVENRPAVLHLIEDDIYIDIIFSNPGWGSGLMSYTRAVPEPATMSLLALGGLAILKRRRRA